MLVDSCAGVVPLETLTRKDVNPSTAISTFIPDGRAMSAPCGVGVYLEARAAVVNSPSKGKDRERIILGVVVSCQGWVFTRLRKKNRGVC